LVEENTAVGVPTYIAAFMSVIQLSPTYPTVLIFTTEDLLSPRRYWT